MSSSQLATFTCQNIRTMYFFSLGQGSVFFVWKNVPVLGFAIGTMNFVIRTNIGKKKLVGPSFGQNFSLTMAPYFFPKMGYQIPSNLGRKYFPMIGYNIFQINFSKEQNNLKLILIDFITIILLGKFYVPTFAKM